MASDLESYRLGSVDCLGPGGFHRTAYREWGRRNPERTVVCVHGLTRNAGDFDELAAHLAGAGWHVVCPDVVGRGASDWLADPAGYETPQYLADMAVLLARLDLPEDGGVHWVGTSMGGLIGLCLAAQTGTPLRSLVMNDIGPLVPQAALEYIASYIEVNPVLPDLAAAEVALRARYEEFGPLPDALWTRVTAQSIRPVEGGYVLSYDPGIARPFLERAKGDIELWPLWQAVACPTLVLRGAKSPLLTAETLEEMTRSGPKAEAVEIPGCGHAPWLKVGSEIAIVADWLERRV